MRRLLPLLAPALVVLASCSDRERANPFDPRNPITQGRPIAFVALAGDGEVTMRWQAIAAEGLLGYQVFRRASGDPGFSQLTAVLPSTISSYQDQGLANGLDYAYRLHYVFETGLGERPAEDLATPGRLRVWCVDANRGTLSRITPDGRHVAFERDGFQGPSAVEVDTTNGTVWISDTFASELIVFEPGSGVTVTIPGVTSPAGLVIDPVDHSAWVCDEDQNIVHHFTPQGDPATLPIAPLSLPIGIALDPADRSVWLCERSGDRVGRYRSDGVRLWNQAVSNPSRVAVDQQTSEGWVTSFEDGRVHRLSPDKPILDTVTGFLGPVGIAVDAVRGRIWVADSDGDRVVALRRNGTTEFEVPDLPGARDVALDLATGEAWVVLAASGEVARLSPAGAVLRRLDGFNTPLGIAVTHLSP